MRAPKKMTLPAYAQSLSFFMNDWQPPLQVNLVDLSFMDTRFKLIEVAAFLDRVQRAGQDTDYRVVALKNAVQFLSQNEPDRAKQVLMSFSDPSEEPIAKATIQGAVGAFQVQG